MFGENLHIGSVIKQQLNNLGEAPHGSLGEGWRKDGIEVKIDGGIEVEMDRPGVHQVLHGHIAPLGLLCPLFTGASTVMAATAIAPPGIAPRSLPLFLNSLQSLPKNYKPIKADEMHN